MPVEKKSLVESWLNNYPEYISPVKEEIVDFIKTSCDEEDIGESVSQIQDLDGAAECIPLKEEKTDKPATIEDIEEQFRPLSLKESEQGSDDKPGVKYKPPEISAIHRSAITFTRKLSELLDEQKFVDCFFEFETPGSSDDKEELEVIGAHKCVLAAGSKVFEELLFGDLQQTPPPIFIMKDIKPLIFEKMVK